MKKIDLLKNAKGLAVVGAILTSLISVPAYADVLPTVSVTIKNASNSTITSANIGTVVHANTEVASSTGSTPLGTVDFSLYPNTTCTSSSSVQSGVLLASGLADSATTTVGSSGLSYKVHYNGQSGVYSVADSNCMPLVATASGTIINTTLSSTTVMVGVPVSQSSVLSGATANATGTVSYNVYTNNSCTLGAIGAGIKTVTNATVPTSDAVNMNTVGTLYFQAKYSGDLNNSAANGPCQSVSVLATSTTPTPTPTPTPVGSGSLSGVSYNDLNKNRTRDNGEAGIGGFTIKLYGGTFWWNWGKMKAIQTTTTDSNGAYTFSGLADGLYRIEEAKLANWNQISSDYRWVLVINGKNLTGLDFANYSRVNASSTNATSTNPRKDDKKEEKKEQKEIKKQNKQIEKMGKLFQKFNKGRGKGEGRDDD